MRRFRNNLCPIAPNALVAPKSVSVPAAPVFGISGALHSGESADSAGLYGQGLHLTSPTGIPGLHSAGGTSIDTGALQVLSSDTTTVLPSTVPLTETVALKLPDVV